MMRALLWMLIFVCCLGLCVPVAASSGVEQLRSDTVVHTDGSCTVALSVEMVLEEAVADPVFPVPREATDVSVNGGGASVSGNQVSLRSVTGGAAGRFAFSLTYRLPEAVEGAPEGGLQLTLPLLSGFAYPIQALRFTVTLPGEISQTPKFTSSYYQQQIQGLITLSVQDNTITGQVSELMDHETLTMTLPVSDAMFPTPAVKARVLGMLDLITVAVLVLAVAYYLLALRPRKIRRGTRATAPDGICAGDLPVWLIGGKVDFSLLVVTWAQLGYLRIQVDDSGRVLLHKRMSMGNERSAFENRCFKNLFGRRLIVDGTGYHYAQLCREMGKKAPQLRDVYRSRSGNPVIFRVLCAIGGMLGGINLAGALDSRSAFLRIALGVAMAVFSWAIQSAGGAMAVRRRMPVYLGGACALVWLILGLIAGQWLGCAGMIAVQFLCGMAAAYGGKRTELGTQALNQILGLRRYMRRVSKKELQRLLKMNPGYFHQLAPYALALGLDRTFARRFGRLRLMECTYLMSGMSTQLTASEWAKLLRTTVNTLDARASRLFWERLTNR